jgi:hypothetical protein
VTDQKLAVASSLVGPLVTTCAIVTLGVALGKHDGLLGGPFMNWLIGVVLFGGLALVLGGCMLGLDALLALFGRSPPAGVCAWAAGLLSPLPVEAVWLVAPPRQYDGLMFGVALLAPIVLAAGVVRLITTLACGRTL